MLYAYRWQVELFFRCIKRTLNALHLWNHEPDGVKIQFYIYLIVYGRCQGSCRVSYVALFELLAS